MAEEKKDGFVVSDRRLFNAEGELRPDAAEEKKEQPKAEEPKTAAKAPASDLEAEVKHIPASDDDLKGAVPPPPSDAQQEDAQKAYARAAREIDDRLASDLGGPRPADFQVTFEKFVTTLYMTAMYQLGFIHEEGKQPRVDILSARQTIDTLDMIQQKTKGNLTPAEKTFLDERLYELRMGYLDMLNAVMQASQQMPPPPEKK